MSNTAIAVVEGAILSAQPAFMAALSDTSLSFEREARFATQVLSFNDFALKVARENPASVIAAVTNLASIGISLNPARKQAYLVPRDGRICLDISYRGLLDLAVESGSIVWAQAHLVHEHDEFTLTGYERPPVHVYAPFGKNRGEVIGVYVVAKTPQGDYLTTTMSTAEVVAIRDRSTAWKAWIEKQKKCPWVTDEGEMFKKTCVKRAAKMWPANPRLQEAIQHLNTDGDEGLAAGERVDAPRAPAPSGVDVGALIAEAQTTTTDADALAFWRAKSGLLSKHPGDYARFKEAVVQHRQRIKAKAGVEDAAVTGEDRALGSDDGGQQ